MIPMSSGAGFAPRYLLYMSLSNLVFYIPTLFVHFQRHGVSTEQIFYLVALYTFVLATTDIPTGALGDSVGPRPVLISSMVLAAVGALDLAVSDSFIGFAIGQTLVALALSLRSGTDAANLFSLCESPDTYQQIEGRSTSTSYLALGTASVVGALLSSIDSTLPFLATVAALGAALAVFVSLPKGPPRLTRRLTPHLALGRAVRRLRVDRQLFLIMAFVAGLLTLTGLAYWSIQLYLERLDVPLAFFGLAYALYFGASALGARSARWINLRLGHGRALLVSGVLLGLCIVAMGLVVGVAGVLLPAVTQFITGYLFPTLRYLVQSRVQADVRATLLSIESVTQRLLFTVGSLLFGQTARIYGIAASLTGAGLLALSLFPPTLIVAHRFFGRAITPVNAGPTSPPARQ